MSRQPTSRPSSRTCSTGSIRNPVRVVSFNTGEGWSQDISADVAEELRRRCDLQMREIPPSLAGFFARHETLPLQLTLRLSS